MKKYIYLMVVAAFPIMAMTCEKEPMYISRHLKPLVIMCPDTVASGVPFELTIHVRMGDCEKLRWENNEKGDTMYLSPKAERRNLGTPCDTSRPFVTGSTTLSFHTTGKKKLIFYAGGEQTDSVYIK